MLRLTCPSSSVTNPSPSATATASVVKPTKAYCGNRGEGVETSPSEASVVVCAIVARPM